MSGEQSRFIEQPKASKVEWTILMQSVTQHKISFCFDRTALQSLQLLSIDTRDHFSLALHVQINQFPTQPTQHFGEHLIGSWHFFIQ